MLKILSRIVIWAVAGVFGIAAVAGSLYAMWQAALFLMPHGRILRNPEDLVIMMSGFVLWAYLIGKLVPLIGDWIIWAFRKDDK